MFQREARKDERFEGRKEEESIHVLAQSQSNLQSGEKSYSLLGISKGKAEAAACCIWKRANVCAA